MDTVRQLPANPVRGWWLLGLILVAAGAVSGCGTPAPENAALGEAAPAGEGPSHDEVRAIAQEAYIYGFPMVDSYRIQYSYFADPADPEYKGAWNEIHNTARVYTPDDKAIQTPNSDTPYSQLGADLRAEPLVISVPAVEEGRYYSAQFIDMYTHNFAYVGSRATGNEAGNFLLAGPGWKGETPERIKQVIRSETELVFVLFRTQLFDADDIEAVRKIQAGYKAQPLSGFLGTPAPSAAPPIEFIRPLAPDAQKTSPDFFRILNFLLQFSPTHPSETALMERFGRIGIGAGKPFDADALPPGQREAIEAGMADAWKTFADYKAAKVDTGEESSADGFGSREFLQNNYLRRMASAVLGIYGNSKEEAVYPAYFTDAAGAALDASAHRYVMRFEPGQLPPVNAFWSVTMYELPSSLLSANPLDRYLVNASMLPSLRKDADGGLTLYLQHESPGDGREANWLPAPEGPFFVVMRIYWPKAEVLDGRWKAPPLQRIESLTGEPQ
ncbi:DUF1254 domain-containing protein [Marilutibacter aestuarii]|uniref:DUF1254 domain-containing protein n=1 Tax=Marilutibacter aestuarii TaxID=1706195 RepID=A0A508ADP8_9GAMM|nr:DUF1254 domain-containing protein [Lysobacter aestuarii]TQD45908.1 DUF1254 domain-containing protein [Lysobacter aestuarii]